MSDVAHLDNFLETRADDLPKIQCRACLRSYHKIEMSHIYPELCGWCAQHRIQMDRAPDHEYDQTAREDKTPTLVSLVLSAFGRKGTHHGPCWKIE